MRWIAHRNAILRKVEYIILIEEGWINWIKIMRNGFSCCMLDGVQKGARRKVCPKHRYHKMACSMVYSKSLLMNVVKTFPIGPGGTSLTKLGSLSFASFLPLFSCLKRLPWIFFLLHCLSSSTFFFHSFGRKKKGGLFFPGLEESSILFFVSKSYFGFFTDSHTSYGRIENKNMFLQDPIIFSFYLKPNSAINLFR